jgi:C_GCAxxG_C_C family probable redox protein
MKEKDKAITYFRKGYNCAQAVLLAAAGESEVTAKAAAAFGGGMGRMQKTCGAVTGAYIYFGLKYGTTRQPQEDDKLKVYDKVRQFSRLFMERNGSDQCSELLGEDLNSSEGMARIRELDLHTRVCEKCVTDAMDIIGQME